MRVCLLGCFADGLNSPQIVPGGSALVGDPVCEDRRFVNPEELYLGFVQQLGQLRDKVLPLLLSALPEGFRRDESVILSVHLSFLSCTLTACSVMHTPHFLLIWSAYPSEKASGYCMAYSTMHLHSRSRIFEGLPLQARRPRSS